MFNPFWKDMNPIDKPQQFKYEQQGVTFIIETRNRQDWNEKWYKILSVSVENKSVPYNQRELWHKTKKLLQEEINELANLYWVVEELDFTEEFPEVDKNNTVFSDDNILNSKETFHTSLTDMIDTEEGLIEKYKLYSFWGEPDDIISTKLVEQINNLKKIFDKKNIDLLVSSNNVYIYKYAFEESILKYDEKEKILLDIVKYFDTVLTQVLKDSSIAHDAKANHPVNAVVPNESGIWIYNIKLSNFFEVYASIIKLWVIDENNFSLNLSHEIELHFSVFDFFRILLLRNKRTESKLGSIKRGIIRKPTVRILEWKEIDYISIENERLYICDAKLRTGYMKQWEKNGKITDEYEDFCRKFDEYKDILFENIDKLINGTLINEFRKNIDFFKNSKREWHVELCQFAKVVTENDIENEIKFREMLNSIVIEARKENYAKFWGFKLSIWNLVEKIHKIQVYKIYSKLSSRDNVALEDVFNRLKPLKCEFLPPNISKN